IRNKFDDYVLENLERTYKLVENNKMQIGFGISSGDDVKRFSSFCDGVIVGSAVIKSLANDDSNFTNTIKLVKELKSACKN
ncbi:MAG: tryptophan synthase subunit alpha, partial [Ignavibacteriae bacterium]|nr:tryptophan synthase subunit alpha [Ignavibacteriota bacterium]